MFAGTGNPLGTSVLLIQPLLGVQVPLVFLSEVVNLLMGFPFDFIHGGLCLGCPGVAALVHTHGLLGALPSRVGDEKSTLGLSCASQGISGWLGESCGTASREDDV